MNKNYFLNFNQEINLSPIWSYLFLLLVGISMIRSSHGRCSVLRGVLKIFTKFTGKHLCQSLFFKKACNFIKKGLWHRCFPVNLAKFLRIPIFIEHLRDCLYMMMFFITLTEDGNNIIKNNYARIDIYIYKPVREQCYIDQGTFK